MTSNSSDPAAWADASLPLNGLPNFRDFGGYATRDGRRVRTGVLYRSQAFAGATEQDLEYLDGLGIRLVCDLRSETERHKAKDRWPTAAAAGIPGSAPAGAPPARLYLDIRNDARAGHSVLIDTIRSQPNPEGVHRGMLLIYRGMPAAFAPVLPELFEHLLDPARLPMVIHCHAGKDRTGFICAVILAALGVDREHILTDYLLTAQRIDRMQLSLELVDTFSAFVGVPLTVEALQVALDVRPEFLDAAMHSLDVDHGGMEGYLRDVARLSAAASERLRENLLF